MNLIELIKTRRTVHSFKSDPLPESLIKQAMELAPWVPNHKNTQPWRFYRLGPLAKNKLTNMAVQIEKEKSNEVLTPLRLETLQKKFSSCPEVLVVARKSEENQEVAKEDYASLACAIHNICLFLWQSGVGTKWSTGRVTRHPDLYNVLKIDPCSIELEGFLWMGYPEIVPKTPPKIELTNIFYTTD